METLASALSHEDDRQRRQTLIESYPRFHPTLDHITVVDRRGMVLESTRTFAADSALLVRGVSDREYFRAAMTKKRTAISDVIASRVDVATPTVVIAAPYLDRQGDVAGVVCGILSLDYFTRLVRQNGSMPELTITILDQRNRVIIASQQAHRQRPGRSDRGSGAELALSGDDRHLRVRPSTT